MKYKNVSKVEADEIIENYLADVCRNILINTACFKPDEKGFNALNKFMLEALS